VRVVCVCLRYTCIVAEQVAVKLRGKPGESVPLLFASATGLTAVSHGSALKCSLVTATISSDGTGVAHFGS
jgi:hypothetical protein